MNENENLKDISGESAVYSLEINCTYSSDEITYKIKNLNQPLIDSVASDTAVYNALTSQLATFGQALNNLTKNTLVDVMLVKTQRQRLEV